MESGRYTGDSKGTGGVRQGVSRNSSKPHGRTGDSRRSSDKPQQVRRRQHEPTDNRCRFRFCTESQSAAFSFRKRAFVSHLDPWEAKIKARKKSRRRPSRSQNQSQVASAKVSPPLRRSSAAPVACLSGPTVIETETAPLSPERRAVCLSPGTGPEAQGWTISQRLPVRRSWADRPDSLYRFPGSCQVPTATGGCRPSRPCCRWGQRCC